MRGGGEWGERGLVFCGVGAGASFVVRGVPAKCRRSGGARSTTGPLWTAVPGTNSRTITAIDGAHSPLSRFARGANTDGFDVPRTGRRGRRMAARASSFEGPRLG